MDKNKLHMVPPIVQDRVEAMLTATSSEAREIYAQQLEVIRDYIIEALNRSVSKRKAS
jgi:hypothetical protein